MFPDVREALKDLLNIKPSLEAAASFISRHGALRPMQPRPAEMRVVNYDHDPIDPRMEVLLYSAFFLGSLQHPEPDVINTYLGAIFLAAQIDGEMRPTALRVDILAGTITPVPRDLLDAIAVEFMRSYKTIGRCQQCQRFFFKEYTNGDCYCSRPCAEQSRKESQRDWMRKHRAEQKREQKSKRRKPRRKV